MNAQGSEPTSHNLATAFLDRNVTEGKGERTAIITRDGARWTYAQLAELVDRAGNVLLQLGLRQHDRVLLALSDSVEFVALWFAAQKIGAVTAEVYTFLKPKDYSYYVQYTDARVVIVDDTTLVPMREALTAVERKPSMLTLRVASYKLHPGEIAFERVVEARSSGLDPAPVHQNDIVIWKFTTGSTGRPKACVHPPTSPLFNYQHYALDVLHLQPDDVVLPVPKLFFGYARDLTALYPFGVGGAGIVFAERTTAEVIFELIARLRPTILVNVPTMMQAMLDHPDAARQDLSSLRLVTSAGEALPEALHQRWLDCFGVEVLDGIGSSEAYHIYISNRPGRVRLGSMGELVPGYSARVMDEAGVAVTGGEIGRLWVTGGSVARMYWDDAEKTRATFSGDTVMSGDLVSVDHDGFFWYQGRADDLLKIGGIWVAPAEIERCLAAHEAVAEAAVVGVEVNGLMRSCAFVALRARGVASDETLRQFVRERLAPHKVPNVVQLVDALPKTGSGKIDRSALRERAVSPLPHESALP